MLKEGLNKKSRYKKRLVASAKDETGILLKQRSELGLTANTLQTQRDSLLKEINFLTGNEQNLEETLRTNKNLLQQTIAQLIAPLKKLGRNFSI